MWRNILSQAVYQLLILVVMLYSLPYWFGTVYNYVNTPWYGMTPDSDYKRIHYTIIFHTFVLMNLFNQLSSRKLGWKDVNIFDNFFNNKWFFFMVGGEFALQYLIVEIGGDIFRTESLTWQMHLTCLAFGFGSLLVNLGVKFIPPEHGVKFEVKLNENETEGSDVLSKMTARFTSKAQRSETMRLLDSN